MKTYGLIVSETDITERLAYLEGKTVAALTPSDKIILALAEKHDASNACISSLTTEAVALREQIRASEVALKRLSDALKAVMHPDLVDAIESGK